MTLPKIEKDMGFGDAVGYDLAGTYGPDETNEPTSVDLFPRCRRTRVARGGFRSAPRRPASAQRRDQAVGSPMACAPVRSRGARARTDRYGASGLRPGLPATWRGSGRRPGDDGDGSGLFRPYPGGLHGAG